ncbi:ubiquinol-cytochrome c reductase iron-sulfur subunit [Variovorax paradoxus]|nr:ubiquinol-cytochrome c reductase iron-sulfur subunit [Variovorax paradoxus]
MGTLRGFIREIDAGAVPDATRRKLLRAATGVVGGAGLLAAAYPFVASLEPSERAKALGGPVQVDVSMLVPGELRTVGWRGKPVWLMRRSEEMVRALRQPDPELADPLSRRSDQPVSCANPTRSKRPEFFVAVGVCTHLGCTPILRLDDVALNAELHAPGGFVCPCHGSRYDLAGRVVKNVPAPTNLEIPDYLFTGASTLRIG